MYLDLAVALTSAAATVGICMLLQMKADKLLFEHLDQQAQLLDRQDSILQRHHQYHDLLKLQSDLDAHMSSSDLFANWRRAALLTYDQFEQYMQSGDDSWLPGGRASLKDHHSIVELTIVRSNQSLMIKLTQGFGRRKQVRHLTSPQDIDVVAKQMACVAEPSR